MGGEALGPVKAQFPSVGECQVREVGVSGWGNTLIEARERGWDRDFAGQWGGGLGKEITSHLSCKYRKYPIKNKRILVKMTILYECKICTFKFYVKLE
jgi:hypothetical protein